MNIDPPKESTLSTAQIVDLGSFRKKKEIKNELARDREPLYSSHLSSSSARSPGKQGSGHGDEDFGDRLNRIRSSLEKINRLIGDLKKMSASNTPVVSADTPRIPQ